MLAPSERQRSGEKGKGESAGIKLLWLLESHDEKGWNAVSRGVLFYDGLVEFAVCSPVTVNCQKPLALWIYQREKKNETESKRMSWQEKSGREKATPGDE